MICKLVNPTGISLAGIPANSSLFVFYNLSYLLSSNMTEVRSLLDEGTILAVDSTMTTVDGDIAKNNLTCWNIWEKHDLSNTDGKLKYMKDVGCIISNFLTNFIQSKNLSETYFSKFQLLYLMLNNGALKTASVYIQDISIDSNFTQEWKDFFKGLIDSSKIDI